jgi:PhnB protein
MANRSKREPDFKPKGWHTLTLRVVVAEPEQFVEFLKIAFAATGEYQREMPTIVTIGDSRLMVSGTGLRETMPAFLYLYVEDADATYRRALQAGASSLEEPGDMPYGDRRAMVKDRWGNTWQIATYRGDPN